MGLFDRLWRYFSNLFRRTEEIKEEVGVIERAEEKETQRIRMLRARLEIAEALEGKVLSAIRARNHRLAARKKEELKRVLRIIEADLKRTEGWERKIAADFPALEKAAASLRSDVKAIRIPRAPRIVTGAPPPRIIPRKTKKPRIVR